MWSLGCVLSEAAVWVCSGQRGRIEFQQRRRDENNEVAPDQRALGRSDCFHNGTKRLRAVSEVLDLVQRDGRRSDELTPKVIRLVLDHLLVDEDSRYDARILSTELDKMIRTTGCPDDRASRCISTASSAPRSHTSQEFWLSHHDGMDDSQGTSPQSQYDALTPCTPIDSMSQNQDPHMERVPSMGRLPTRDSSFRSQISPTEPWNHSNGDKRLHRMDSGQISITLPKLNAIHSMHRDQSATSPIDEGRHSNDHRRAQTATVGQGLVQRHTGPEKFSDQPWPAQRAPKIVTNGSKSTVTPSQPTDHKRTTFPDISMETVGERRSEGKAPKSRRLLPGEDQAMVFLKQRDHVSLRRRH